jgi:hypothetical protein
MDDILELAVQKAKELEDPIGLVILGRKIARQDLLRLGYFAFAKRTQFLRPEEAKNLGRAEILVSEMSRMRGISPSLINNLLEPEDELGRHKYMLMIFLNFPFRSDRRMGWTSEYSVHILIQIVHSVFCHKLRYFVRTSRFKPGLPLPIQFRFDKTHRTRLLAVYELIQYLMPQTVFFSRILCHHQRQDLVLAHGNDRSDRIVAKVIIRTSGKGDSSLVIFPGRDKGVKLRNVGGIEVDDCLGVTIKEVKRLNVGTRNLLVRIGLECVICPKRRKLACV